jgi:hypothetical protein
MEPAKAWRLQSLGKVLQSNADKHPDLGPENKLEKIKAEKLLQKIDDIF